MNLAEGLQEILDAGSLGLYLLQRLMRFLHLADGIRERVRVNTRHQLYIALVTVIAKPVVGALLAVGLHREQDVIIQAAILREVLEDALDGEFQSGHIFIADLFTDAFLHTAQFLGEASAHHHTAPLAQDLYRVANQDRPVEDLKEAGIGTDERGFELVAIFVKVSVSIEDIRGAGTRFNARYLFHEAHRHGAADLAIIVLIPLLGIPGADRVHPVDVLVKAIVTQLKEHLGNEHDPHRQPHTQGQDFDQNVVLLFHPSCSLPLFSLQRTHL